MNIRLARQEDLLDIIKIEEICFPKAEAATSQDFHKRFEAFSECFLVAVKDEKIVGFVNGCTTDEPCLPDELYHDASLHNPKGDYQTVFGLDVLPNYQRQGIAKALLDAFITLAKERGKKGMVLTCKNHLIHYYQKFGFQHVGVSASSHGGAKWNDMLLIFEKDEMIDAFLELQSLAQAGLYYGRDKFDKERYQRIREISINLISKYTNKSLDQIIEVFCHDKGYQTPKLDTRAAVFNEEGKILLVQENDGLWSLPGGWVDFDLSVQENTIKEVKEEAGLDVETKHLIAIMDRDKHNLPRYLYKVIKIFVLCERVDGTFEKNIETVQSQYFSVDQLPPLATAKNTQEQIEMCFQAYHDKQWKTYFD